MSGKWIQGAIKHPGALRKALGVKKGQKIPESELSVKSSDSPTMKKRKVLARTLGRLRK